MIHYTTGYTGKRPELLLPMLLRYDATLFDIRYSAGSRVLQWRGEALAALLGDRYRHVPTLGNRNYNNGGPIEITDLERGIGTVLASPRPVVLFCACALPDHCHRMTVARALAQRPAVEYILEIYHWRAA